MRTVAAPDAAPLGNQEHEFRDRFGLNMVFNTDGHRSTGRFDLQGDQWRLPAIQGVQIQHLFAGQGDGYPDSCTGKHGQGGDIQGKLQGISLGHAAP